MTKVLNIDTAGIPLTIRDYAEILRLAVAKGLSPDVLCVDGEDIPVPSQLLKEVKEIFDACNCEKCTQLKEEVKKSEESQENSEEVTQEEIQDVLDLLDQLGEELDDLQISEDYETLSDVLHRAYSQAAYGKGAERHADGKPFEEQPMQEIAKEHGIGFITGQARKKTEEALGMLERDETDAAIKELLGAIVYLAGAVVFIEENRED